MKTFEQLVEQFPLSDTHNNEEHYSGGHWTYDKEDGRLAAVAELHRPDTFGMLEHDTCITHTVPERLEEAMARVYPHWTGEYYKTHYGEL